MFRKLFAVQVMIKPGRSCYSSSLKRFSGSGTSWPREAPWERCKSFVNPCTFWREMRPLHFSILRMFWVPVFFLIFYYLLQLHYQWDLGFLCPHNIWNDSECKRTISPNTTTNPTNLNSTIATPLLVFYDKDHDECCRKWTKKRYGEWGARATKLSSLLSFLLGFYVARIYVLPGGAKSAETQTSTTLFSCSPASPRARIPSLGFQFELMTQTRLRRQVMRAAQTF